jgi:hypothetical protein
MLDQLRKRLEELKAERDQWVQRVVEAQHTVSAYNGAIEECERTIALLSEPQPEPAQE